MGGCWRRGYESTTTSQAGMYVCFVVGCLFVCLFVCFWMEGMHECCTGLFLAVVLVFQMGGVSFFFFLPCRLREPEGVRQPVPPWLPPSPSSMPDNMVRFMHIMSHQTERERERRVWFIHSYPWTKTTHTHPAFLSLLPSSVNSRQTAKQDPKTHPTHAPPPRRRKSAPAIMPPSPSPNTVRPSRPSVSRAREPISFTTRRGRPTARLMLLLLVVVMLMSRSPLPPYQMAWPSAGAVEGGGGGGGGRCSSMMGRGRAVREGETGGRPLLLVGRVKEEGEAGEERGVATANGSPLLVLLLVLMVVLLLVVEERARRCRAPWRVCVCVCGGGGSGERTHAVALVSF